MSASVLKNPLGVLYDSHGGQVILARKIISSGEGSIYTTSEASLLAKIYHEPSLLQGEKLKVMLGHGSKNWVAWPQSLIYENGQIIGFLMPKIRDAKPLPFFYHPRLRRQHMPDVTWYTLHKIACHTARALAQLHQENIIIGDIKAENILVYANGHPCFLDADSFQIEDSKTKAIFNSSVGSEGFIPPELIGKHLGNIRRTQEHDRFGLAVLIYYLLFGEHPFKGVWHGEGEPLSVDEKVYRGLTPLRRQKLISKSPLSLPISILPLPLKDAFERAFVHGHLDPTKRPTAEEWSRLLGQSEKHLELCERSGAHFFYRTSNNCPWCVYFDQTQVDLFKNSYGVRKEDRFHTEKTFECALHGAQFTQAKTLLKAGNFMESKEQYERDIVEAETVFNKLTPLREALKAAPRKDPVICKLWEEFPYKNSDSLAWRGFYFQGEPIIKAVARSVGRVKAFKDFNMLVETSRILNRPPLYYFDELVEIFTSVIIEVDVPTQNWPDEWENLETRSQNLSKKFGFLKKSILEENGEGILQYWDEFFERHLRKMGLEIPAQVILDSYFAQICKDSFDVDTLTLMPTKGGYFLKGLKQLIPRTLQNKSLPIRFGFLIKSSQNPCEDLFIEGAEFSKKGGKVFLAWDKLQACFFKKRMVQGKKVALSAQGAIALGSYLFGFGDRKTIKQRPGASVVYAHIEGSLPWFIQSNYGKVKIALRRKGVWLQFYSPCDVSVPGLNLVLHPYGEIIIDSKVELAQFVGKVDSFRLEAFRKRRIWVTITPAQEAKRGALKKAKLTLALNKEKSDYREDDLVIKFF